jgi:activator of HSP90 ATPase
MAKQIKQRVTLNATPRQVYEALMDSRAHAAFTGAKAKISRRIGGRFQAYGPYIAGINVELVEGKRIVQAWRGSDWPKGEYSIATFELERAPGGKTRLTFTQSGVPDKHHRDIAQGWKDFYWDKLKRFLRTGAAGATPRTGSMRASARISPRRRGPTRVTRRRRTKRR